MSGIEIILGVLLGLIVNEACDVSPWLARKLVKKAPYLQYRDRERAAMRAEELTAVVNERPGKLLKLATAVAFAAGALVVRLKSLIQDFWTILRLAARLYLAMAGRSRDQPRAKAKKRKTKKAARIGGTTGQGKTEAVEVAIRLPRDVHLDAPVKGSSQEMEERVRRLLPETQRTGSQERLAGDD
ncbi:hypothetical protein [Nonomuraea sp. NPDC005650]|uniref:hypothetical protein n=1 Tax=Nonomuraea sp. NPDC005650 TaxID=3157045 RepID=UPI0033A9DAD9